VVGWRMARALELFFYLLDAGRPVRKEQIIAALWPEANEQVDHTFHNTVYNDDYTRIHIVVTKQTRRHLWRRG